MEKKESKLNLYGKMLEIRKSVPYLQKSSTGPQFQYVSSSQVLAAVRSKMDELGILIIPSVTSTNLLQFTTKNGSPQFMTELWVDMTWVDSDSGEELIIKAYGQGVDKNPKKALIQFIQQMYPM